jgi:hypothetical protein
MSLDAFGTQDNWGIIEESVVSTFIDWVEEKKLEPKKLSVFKIMMNSLHVSKH